MRVRFGLLCAFVVAACAAVAGAKSTEIYYVPVIMQSGLASNLYLIKVNATGGLLRGPTLIKDMGGSGMVRSASAVGFNEGDRILWTQAVGATTGLYWVPINRKTGAPAGTPALVTGDPGYVYLGIWISSEGRKFFYGRSPMVGVNWDIFMKRFMHSGKLDKKTVNVLTGGPQDMLPYVNHTSSKLWYNDATGSPVLNIQNLSKKGTPSGAPAVAVSGNIFWHPMVDMSEAWMSYYDVVDRNTYVTRITPAGVATGSPIKVTNAAPVTEWAAGGILRSGKAVIYSLRDATGSTLYSQVLDSNGNPTGAPVVLIPRTAAFLHPWVMLAF